jgi:hypothetical protein
MNVIYSYLIFCPEFRVDEPNKITKTIRQNPDNFQMRIKTFYIDSTFQYISWYYVFLSACDSDSYSKD